MLTRAAAEHMSAGGVIVNIASLAGKLGVPGAAVYSGTKAGLRFWALAAAEELARRGLRIANVSPGPVDTGFWRRARARHRPHLLPAHGRRRSSRRARPPLHS